MEQILGTSTQNHFFLYISRSHKLPQYGWKTATMPLYNQGTMWPLPGHPSITRESHSYGSSSVLRFQLLSDIVGLSRHLNCKNRRVCKILCVHNFGIWYFYSFGRFYHKWASSWDYGTYRIGDQRRLRRACASAQSRQSLRCSQI